MVVRLNIFEPEALRFGFGTTNPPDASIGTSGRPTRTDKDGDGNGEL